LSAHLGRHRPVNSINDSGQIVGGSNEAFLYSGGVMYNLDSLTPGSGWELSDATGINNSGQIVGYGLNPAGQTHAFLLNPVPEPSTMVLLASAVFTVCVLRWKCKKAIAPASN
jgi:probable HAF family extracellular repeat protein